MNILQELQHLGFTNTEAKIWRAALELGEADVTALARHARIPRTSIYDALEKLIDRGLIDFYIKKRRRYYMPSRPERLLVELSTKTDDAQKLIPALRALSRKTQATPQITLHEGMEGIRTVLDHILETRRPFSAITSLEDFQAVAERPFAWFVERRIAQNLRVRLITIHSAAAERFAANDSKELRETRLLPPSFRFHTATHIFGHHIAIFSLRRQVPSAVLIHDIDIAATQQMQFEFLWEHAKSPRGVHGDML
ncbi:MAG: hypothetical protein A2806_02665 [Candidatus Terrybacteria bacterium RIFCSPHIGHO2_01_FULL_48_17]|uniref:Transcription regulator TrmB N-terminal domain-containing protein n=1 Tax=Candidatus Terrybacteria bacterium RIFCSPHIGHO2_01_FULL_48_17 TaxID=1802362 RepID=A0A1G2PK07_9BACT|nr:MAG: hypothetical protein A2806_02665 [Candidatus Terrybacteria bacterium RIFCSPHIGHO2_01_FULL_48_17]OHA52084.1 MAG: hypothetical protein A3A30_04205 [Candidatus Terrybacteria bacterium RIFCSPLOWO2_01_FULL_48_14]